MPPVPPATALDWKSHEHVAESAASSSPSLGRGVHRHEALDLSDRLAIVIRANHRIGAATARPSRTTGSVKSDVEGAMKPQPFHTERRDRGVSQGSWSTPRNLRDSSSVHPTGQKSRRYLQVEGHTVRLIAATRSFAATVIEQTPGGEASRRTRSDRDEGRRTIIRSIGRRCRSAPHDSSLVAAH